MNTSINLSDLDLRIAIIITGGRTGSDFFQSLTDGHPEILQFPGKFLFDEFWNLINSDNSNNYISELFCNEYSYFFNSQLNTIERLHQLGEDKNKFFTVDLVLFKVSFCELMDKYLFSKSAILYCLHIAYYVAAGFQIRDKKLLILHLHDYLRLEVMKDLECEILYFLRDPIKNLQSGVEGRLRYKEDKSLSYSWYIYYLNRLVNGLEITASFGKKTFVIQLEKIHKNHKKLMDEFCDHFEIRYDRSLETTSYHGLKWWGDMLSEKFQNGVNPNFQNHIDLHKFFKSELYLLERALKPQLKFYNYPLRSINSYSNILSLLPFRYELIIWWIKIRECRINEIIKIPVHWIRRIRIINKKKKKSYNYPPSIG